MGDDVIVINAPLVGCADCGGVEWMIGMATAAVPIPCIGCRQTLIADVTVVCSYCRCKPLCVDCIKRNELAGAQRVALERARAADRRKGK